MKSIECFVITVEEESIDKSALRKVKFFKMQVVFGGEVPAENLNFCFEFGWDGSSYL